MSDPIDEEMNKRIDNIRLNHTPDFHVCSSCSKWKSLAGELYGAARWLMLHSSPKIRMVGHDLMVAMTKAREAGL